MSTIRNAGPAAVIMASVTPWHHQRHDHGVLAGLLAGHGHPLRHLLGAQPWLAAVLVILLALALLVRTAGKAAARFGWAGLAAAAGWWLLRRWHHRAPGPGAPDRERGPAA